MRDQYAGDVSDVLKFAFLRALAGKDRTLGIAWYYAPGDDGRPDGRHLEWRNEDAWRLLDEELHTGLSTLPERSVVALEQANIWPTGSLFHREPMPSRAERSTWNESLRATLNAADIVFLDPDNGLGTETEKHATYEEVRLLRRAGRMIAFITFPGKTMTHDALLDQLHGRLVVEADAERVVTLRTNVSVPRDPGSRYFVQRQRWFTMVDPDPVLVERAAAFASALKKVPRVSGRLDELLPPDEEKKLSLTVDELVDCGFTLSGRWRLSNSGELELEVPAPVVSGMYAFALNGIVQYVGVGTIGLAKRLSHYAKPGISQITNQRLNRIIKNQMRKSSQVEIYTASPPDLDWNGLPIHGSAGLELGLIKKYALPWNSRN